MSRARRRARAACLLALVGLAARAAAHPPVDAVATVRVSATNELTIVVMHDVLAFALNDTSRNIPDGPMFELLAGPDEALDRALAEARQRFATLCVLTVDGARVPLEVVAAPTLADVRDWQRRRRWYPLPVRLEMTAHAALPAGARAFRVRFPEMLGDLILAVERTGHEPVALPLTPNELSPEFALTSHSGDASGVAAPGAAPEIAAATQGTWAILKRFAALGFTHIIPHGADHGLFVLGLFLLSPRLRPVLIQVCAFTVAHTITLTLTSLGIIGLPSWVVEPFIALSIIFVGIENLFTAKADAKRTIVAFLFGLVHGMGVATAFNEAGFPKGQLVASLAAFTVGVEAGHLAVLALAFAALGWCRGRAWYRRRMAVPLSLGISGMAMVWLVQRIAAAV